MHCDSTFYETCLLAAEELLRIERVENKKIRQKYKLHRAQVQEEFQNNSCDAADVELWLWHGSS